MSRMPQMLGIAGIAIVGCVSVSCPVYAQATNQSDTSGTNVFNSSAPQFPSSSPVSPAVVNAAAQTSQSLADAKRAFDAAERAASLVTRQFSAGAADPTCQNPVSNQLNQSVDAARAFLERVSGQPVPAGGGAGGAGFKIW